MELDKETSKKIEELQALESHMQGFLAQKQTIEMELSEIENAIGELKNSDENVYKIISGIMIKSAKDKIGKELEEEKKVLEMKVGALEKQESLLEKNASELREELNKAMSGRERKKK